MVTERTRTEIWQGLWDAKRMVRYYQMVHKRYQTLNQATMWILVVLGTSALAVLWDKMPPLVQAAMGLAVAGMSLWVLFADYAAKAAVAHSIALRCEEFAIEWTNLFAEVYDPENTAMDEQRARESMENFKKRLANATYASGYAKLADNDKINQKATVDAAEELEASYA